MQHLAAALLILVMLALPSGALAQAGVSYQVPADNPFAGQAGATPEVYAFGLRNPFRFSFDRLNGDVLIGDVGGARREEIDWVTAAEARGANFGWACEEGSLTDNPPRPADCPVPGAIKPLFDYATAGPDAVTGGFVVRDPSLLGLEGRYLYADFFGDLVRSLRAGHERPRRSEHRARGRSAGVLRAGRGREAVCGQPRRAGLPAGLRRVHRHAGCRGADRPVRDADRAQRPSRATRRACSWASAAGRCGWS